MTEIPFADRMAAAGLTLPPAEAARLEALVKDLDSAAAAMRAVERSYAEEPSNVFRLRPASK